jgi:hypothetical protein
MQLSEHIPGFSHLTVTLETSACSDSVASMQKKIAIFFMVLRSIGTLSFKNYLYINIDKISSFLLEGFTKYEQDVMLPLL